MMDSLPYRNDASVVLGRLIRSLPTRAGVLGVATCDKGLPAMMMALAAAHNLPTVIVPGGVTLPADDGEDAGTVQTIGARFAHGKLSLERGGANWDAAPARRRAAAVSFSARRRRLRSSRKRSDGGRALRARALGTGDLARHGAAVVAGAREPARTEVDDASRMLTDAAIRNAMVMHAAFGGSTNLLLHLPAVAHAAGLRRPTVEDWIDVNHRVPRLVDSLPNGPHPTVRVFLAGGVPEVMLHVCANWDS